MPTSASGLPVADPWFRLAEVSPGLVRIDEPHADPLVRGNIWWLHGGDRDLVVDTGLGVGSLWVELPQLFERNPVVVLTHGHLDHAGGASEFEEVWAHPGDRLDSPTHGTLDGPALVTELGADASALTDPVPALLIDAVPVDDYDPATYRLEPAATVHALADGDVIDLGDRTFTVLHLPGHSAGTIALWDAADGTLFTGDAVYDDELLDQLDGSSIPDYVASMRRLRELPVVVVHPGHGVSIPGARFTEIVDAYLSLRGNQ